MPDLPTLLAQSAARHSHLCPRQVLGVRMGLFAGELLDVALPQRKHRLLTLVETDGCFADGVEVATGCSLGHRTLRLADYGKIAAVFVDTQTGRAVRLAPRLDIRERVRVYAPQQTRAYFAQLEGYQRMPAEELFTVAEVALALPVEAILSRPGVRAECAECGEEIVNEREIEREGRVLCQACVGAAYYLPCGAPAGEGAEGLAHGGDGVLGHLSLDSCLTLKPRYFLRIAIHLDP